MNTPDSELPENDLRMKTPPPVSGKAYPTEVGSQARSNYLSGGINFNTGYNSNVFAGGTGTPVSDMTYSISHDRLQAHNVTTGRVVQV